MSETYDPRATLLAIGGNIISGFADGSFISAKRNEDTWSLVVGAFGEVTRVRNRNTSGELTFTLQASSPSNDILSALIAVDELTGTGIVPCLLKDLLGTMLVSGERTFLKKPADVEVSKDLPNREWTLIFKNMDINPGHVGL
jgi:hypothetical protein